MSTVGEDFFHGDTGTKRFLSARSLTSLGLRYKLVGMSDILSSAGSAEGHLLADRPSPAIPLLVMAAVPIGAIILALARPPEIDADSVTLMDDGTTMSLVGPSVFSSNFWPGLVYWAVATALAYLLISLIARWQGYQGGIWANRRPLVIAGLIALAAALLIMFGLLIPGDLLDRGYLPLVAMAIAIVYWGFRENRPSLWIFGAVVTALALTANLYNMENMLYHAGIPTFSAASDIINLAVIAAALLLGSAGFALAHASRPRHAARGER